MLRLAQLARLQVGHKGLQSFVGHILSGIAQLVDDAVPDLSLWKGGVNGHIKSRPVICVSNKNILCAPVFQAVEHSCPELGALIFANPHTQDVFPVIKIDTNSNVYRFLRDLPLLRTW